MGVVRKRDHALSVRTWCGSLRSHRPNCLSPARESQERLVLPGCRGLREKLAQTCFALPENLHSTLDRHGGTINGKHTETEVHVSLYYADAAVFVKPPLDDFFRGGRGPS